MPVTYDSALNALNARGGKVDILVNNAGYLGRTTPFETHLLAEWQRIISINLIGLMQVTQALLPHTREWGGGRIVNMGSLAGKQG